MFHADKKKVLTGKPKTTEKKCHDISIQYFILPKTKER
jgi:hypothetical protein